MSDTPDDYEFDDSDEDEGALEDDWEMNCGLMHDGQCSNAGSEWCDFECPLRNSDLFVGSAAWRAKHAKRSDAP